MIGLCYVLVGLAALAVGGMVTFGVWGRQDKTRADNATDLYEGEREKFDAMKGDRDVEHARADTLQKQNVDALDRLSIAESQRNQATAALAGKVADGIKNAPTALDALAAVNALVLPHLSAGAAASASDDHREAAPLPPAAEPTPGGAGGNPGPK